MILYVDASAGVSGDMLLAAMRDLGLPAGKVRQSLRRLGSGAPRIAGDLIRWIQASRLEPSIKKNVLRVWMLLARAEAQAHRCSWTQVHFHQLSRPEAMKNVVGFCVGLAHFRIRRVTTGVIPIGNLWRDHSGRLRREPGPTASRLLERLPVKRSPVPFEWTTPTGAALLAAFASVRSVPFRVVRLGHAVGRLKSPGARRSLRLILGREL